MKSGLSLSLVLASAILSVAASASAHAAPPQPAKSASAPPATIVYRNAEYGFCFLLPAGWKGYLVLNEQWRGDFLKPDPLAGQVIHGPQLRIRHPGWTQQHPYEDIPIMVFTPEEWKKVEKGTMAVSAAPIGPSELGQNSRFVFALPPRYNFDFSTGWQEVENLVEHKPLQAPCAAAGKPR